MDGFPREADGKKCASAVRSNGGEACLRDTCEEHWITAVTSRIWLRCITLYDSLQLARENATDQCCPHNQHATTSTATLQILIPSITTFYSVVMEWEIRRAKLRQIVTANVPTPNFLQFGCTSCCPTNSVRALKKNLRRRQYEREKSQVNIGWYITHYHLSQKRNKHISIFCESSCLSAMSSIARRSSLHARKQHYRLLR